MTKKSFVILMTLLFVLTINHSSVAERKSEGFYVEVAPQVLFPLIDPGFSSSIDWKGDGELTPAYGLRVSGGYDANWLGVRGSLYYFQMREKFDDHTYDTSTFWGHGLHEPMWSKPEERIDFFGADLDLQFFLLEMLDKKNQMLQPYLVIGGGVLGGNGTVSPSEFEDSVGFLGKVGGGLNIYVTDQISLGFETSYQPGVLFHSINEGNVSHSESSDLHFINAAFTVAYHF